MRMKAYQIEEWLYRNRRKIIRCPYQPGDLRITLWGCKQRKRQAKRLDLMDFIKSDQFDYAYKNGLLRCRDCTIIGTRAYTAISTDPNPAEHEAA